MSHSVDLHDMSLHNLSINITYLHLNNDLHMKEIWKE